MQGGFASEVYLYKEKLRKREREREEGGGKDMCKVHLKNRKMGR